MASFTALNGDARSPVSPTETPANKRHGSEERTPSQQLAADSSPRQPLPAARGRWSSHGPERLTHPSSDRHDPESTKKRKRSKTPERHQENSLPQETRASIDQRDHEMDRQEHESWQVRVKTEAQRDGRRSSTTSLPSPDSPQNNDSYGDPLSRHIDNMDSRGDYSAMSPDGEENSMGYYASSQHGNGLVHSDPKKRKRNFSNRTKTGCLTCRKRKKKCDEARPTCTNCLRGAFECMGYPDQRGFQKVESKPSAVPLESKDPSYVPPGAYGMPQQHSNYPHPSHSSHPAPLPPVQSPTAGPPPVSARVPQAIGAQMPQPTSVPVEPPIPRSRRDSSPHIRGHMARLVTPSQRQLLHESTAPTITPTSADSPVSKLPLPSPSNYYPTPISAQAKSATSLQSAMSFEPRSPEQQRLPPVHAVHMPEREEREAPRHEVHSHDRLHPLDNYAQRHDERVETQTISPTSPAYADPRVAARLALSQTANRAVTPTRTQKQEMVRGAPYIPHDEELVLERQRCSAACWRFNKACNPNKGIAASEQIRLFKQILCPDEPVALPRDQMTQERFAGHVGEDVIIEAPFNCDYGYNISIGNNVLIGRNCTILDPVRVSIGTNCVIGPNVSIYATTLETDPRARRGAKSQQTGRAIVIEEDVFIGGGSIILPGVKIGRGSTVGAGSVVTRDVKPYCVAIGNPAQVKRGT